MTRMAAPDELHRWLARSLALGTLVSVVAVIAGLVMALIAGQEGGEDGAILDVIGRGEPSSVVAGGLLALALVPVLVLAVAVAAFLRAGERRYALIATGGLLLLAAGLTAALVAPASGA